jgi:hypothetical protein
MLALNVRELFQDTFEQGFQPHCRKEPLSPSNRRARPRASAPAPDVSLGFAAGIFGQGCPQDCISARRCAVADLDGERADSRIKNMAFQDRRNRALLERALIVGSDSHERSEGTGFTSGVTGILFHFLDEERVVKRAFLQLRSLLLGLYRDHRLIPFLLCVFVLLHIGLVALRGRRARLFPSALCLGELRRGPGLRKRAIEK